MQLCVARLGLRAHLAFGSSVGKVAAESFGRAPKKVSSVRNIETDEEQNRQVVRGGTTGKKTQTSHRQER